jgi:hypothetical protein
MATMSREAVGDRHVHRARERDRNVAGINRHFDARIDGDRDERHAQLSITEIERRQPMHLVVAEDASIERRGEGWRLRCEGSSPVAASGV